MNWDRLLEFGAAGKPSGAPENVELTRCLYEHLSAEELLEFSGFWKLYRRSTGVIQVARLVFFPALALLVASLLPGLEWLAGWRGHLGLTMASAMLCVHLLGPLLEGAIDGLQDLTNRAMARGGRPPYDIRY